SEEHTSELQSLTNLVCRLLLEKKKDQARKCNRADKPEPCTSSNGLSVGQHVANASDTSEGYQSGLLTQSAHNGDARQRVCLLRSVFFRVCLMLMCRHGLCRAYVYFVDRLYSARSRLFQLPQAFCLHLVHLSPFCADSFFFFFFKDPAPPQYSPFSPPHRFPD